jgi:hypothetical protein
VRYLYLDESGDLGFDFINKKPSKFFIVTVLVVQKRLNNLLLSKAVKKTLKRKFNIKKERTAELKGSKCPLEIKRYFYGLVENVDFGIYAITLNKIRVYENLRVDKERVYNYVSRLVFDQIFIIPPEEKVEIIIDRSKTKRNIYEFNEYILRQIKSKVNPSVPLNISHNKSQTDFGLQAVDLFCWGIFRKYERKDCEWFNVFKEKVKYDTLYLP